MSVAAALVTRAGALAARQGRTILGLAGAPGAGKSTLAAGLAAAVPGAIVVPLDGFHRTTADLDRLGWTAERGTPRTFDAAGYVALLRELAAGREVRAPDFDRTLEEPVPDAILVPARCPLVITEGNYLLLDVAPWGTVRGLLTESWFITVPEPVRIARLIARFVAFGWPSDIAAERVRHGSDAANARLVAPTAARADLVVRPAASSTAS